MALDLRHLTPAQFADRFWARLRLLYRDGNKFEFARMIHRLYSWVQAGDLTNDQVRVSFNAAYGRSLNPAQWNTFVNDTLVPIKDKYLSIIQQEDL